MNGVYDATSSAYDGTFCYETTTGRKQPRALFIDTDPGTLDVLRGGRLKNFCYSENHVISGKEGSANNFARGFNMGGKTIHNEVMVKLVREVEKCDSFLGFFNFHSIGGGTGSGYFAKLQEDILDVVGPKKISVGFTNKPSNAFSQTVEPINASLAISRIHKTTEIKFTFDNQSLYNLLVDLNVPQPTFANMNEIVAQFFSNFAISMRGDYNIFQLYNNNVPFPSVNFLSTAVVPLKYKMHSRPPQDIWNLTFDAFTTHQEMINIDLSKGKYMCCSVLYRGSLSVKDMHACLNKIRSQNVFVSWMPTGFKTSLTNTGYAAPPGFRLDRVPQCVSKLSNHTAMGHVFEVMQERMNVMLSKRAYIHWYLDEGMNQQQFKDVNDVVSALIGIYDDCINADLREAEEEE